MASTEKSLNSEEKIFVGISIFLLVIGGLFVPGVFKPWRGMEELIYLLFICVSILIEIIGISLIIAARNRRGAFWTLCLANSWLLFWIVFQFWGSFGYYSDPFFGLLNSP